MFKKISIIVMTALMALAMAVPTMAEHYAGDSSWAVVFTPEKKMESNFTSANMDDTLNQLQPGDDATFTVAVSNQYNGQTNWYMSNKAIQSLEDASKNAETSGGAYIYKLTYVDAAGKEKVLFNSEDVGGEMTDAMKAKAGEGLHEATNALEDYFLLDNLQKGNSGQVTLFVGLDGETQNNDYQDTLAQLQMNFAVEVEGEDRPPQTTTPNVPKTGDTNNPFIYFIIIGAAGVLLLAAAILRVVAGRKREEK